MRRNIPRKMNIIAADLRAVAESIELLARRVESGEREAEDAIADTIGFLTSVVYNAHLGCLVQDAHFNRKLDEIIAQRDSE